MESATQSFILRVTRGESLPSRNEYDQNSDKPT